MGFQTSLPILKMAFLLGVTGTLLSCGGNLFEAASGKTSHDAVIESVRKLTNALAFDEAIAIIEANPNLTTTREDKLLFAAAYAGSCGLTFAGVFESLSSASGSPMEFAKDAFTTVEVSPDQCYEAQLWIERIGISSLRLANENIAMFLIGLAKVGTYLRNRADADMDGVLDAGYDSCSSASLPADEVRHVLTGFGLMIENVNSLGSSVSAGFSTALTDLSTACGVLGIPCTETDINEVLAADVTNFRDAIKSDSTTSLGIESCAISPLCCP